MSGRRVLVTGATGFVGGHLTCRLLEDGWQVAALVLPSSDVHRLDERVRAYELDGETSTVMAHVAAVRPDVVIHLASLFIAEHSSDQVKPLVEGNVLFGAQLLEAMDAAGVDALVNTGTSWQHFEGAEYDPVCLYAATKQAFEAIAAFYVNARGLRMQTLHLFDTYGPDDPRPKLFHVLRAAAASGETLKMSPGEQAVDLVHVDDVVEAFLVATERAVQSPSGTSEVWAVSSGEQVSLRELVGRWQAAAGRNVSVEWGGREYRQREVMQPWRGASLPGWMPKWPLDAGLADMERHGVNP